MTGGTGQGRVAVVTGGARGIGEAIVRELARDHHVAFTWRKSRNRAETLANGDTALLALQADFCDPAVPEKVIERTIERFGRIDVIVNNAGIAHTEATETADFDRYREMMNINSVVPMALLKAALPHLREGSAVVNLSSVNAQVPPAIAGAFAASKAALEAFTAAAAKEFGPRGIRINAVAPGIIAVDDVERPQQVREKYCAMTPLGRFGKPAEIARAVRFLATDESSYITGECLRVAGGFGR